MDALFELIFNIILEPIVALLVEGPIALAEQSLTHKKVPKWLRVILIILILLALFAVIGAVIVGAVFVANPETPKHKTAGIILLSVGLTLFAGYVTFTVTKYVLDAKREKRSKKNETNTKIQTKYSSGTPSIGNKVCVLVDRPKGSKHPVSGVVYEVNFGFAPEFSSNDKYQNAYVLGVDNPAARFEGILAAIIHRYDTNEDVWVVVPENYDISDDVIIEKTRFLEQYFDSTLIR